MIENHRVKVVQSSLIGRMLFSIFKIKGFVQNEVCTADWTVTGIEDITRLRSWEVLFSVCKNIVEIPLLVGEVYTIANDLFNLRLKFKSNFLELFRTGASKGILRNVKQD